MCPCLLRVISGSEDRLDGLLARGRCAPVSGLAPDRIGEVGRGPTADVRTSNRLLRPHVSSRFPEIRSAAALDRRSDRVQKDTSAKV